MSPEQSKPAPGVSPPLRRGRRAGRWRPRPRRCPEFVAPLGPRCPRSPPAVGRRPRSWGRAGGAEDPLPAAAAAWLAGRGRRGGPGPAHRAGHPGGLAAAWAAVWAAAAVGRRRRGCLLLRLGLGRRATSWASVPSPGGGLSRPPPGPGFACSSACAWAAATCAWCSWVCWVLSVAASFACWAARAVAAPDVADGRAPRTRCGRPRLGPAVKTGDLGRRGAEHVGVDGVGAELGAVGRHGDPVHAQPGRRLPARRDGLDLLLGGVVLLAEGCRLLLLVGDGRLDAGPGPGWL